MVITMKKTLRIVFYLILTVSLSVFAAVASAAEEGDILLTVNDEPENICFGIDYPLPAPSASDEEGNDMTDRITVTVQHLDGDWTDVSGFSSIPWTPGMTFPVTEHVEYHVIYAVPDGGENARAVKILNVMDTLQSVSVFPEEITLTAGSSLFAERLTVTALYSRSGEVPVSADGFTLNTDEVDFLTAGQYTASVSVTSPYGGTKTAQFTVTVEEEEKEEPTADLSSLSLRIDAEGSTADIPFGGEYLLPGVTVTATDREGSILDLSGSVLISVCRIDGEELLPVEGMTELPDTPEARLIPITGHGSYLIVYSVTNGSLSAEEKFTLNVHDTLQSISASPTHFSTAVGTAPSYEELKVTALYSLSGEIPLSEGTYTLDTDGVDLSAAGTYTAVVSFTDDYGGTKLAAVLVTVTEDIPAADDTSVSLTVNAEKTTVPIPYGGTYVLPTAAVIATDASGEPIDLSGNVVFTVWRESRTGWTQVEDLGGNADDENARTIPITEHGIYKIVYSVRNGELTAEAEFRLDVMDTLLSISVYPDEFRILSGKVVTPGLLTVKALYSLSGEVNVPSEQCTINTDSVNSSVPGEYLATVSYSAPYGGTKTAEIRFIVMEDVPDVDLSSVTIKLSAYSNQANAAYDYTFNLPAATVSATDKKGNPIDLSGAVTVSFYHSNGNGWEPLPGKTNQKYSPAILNLPISLHGSYRVVYSVVNGDLRSDAEYIINVQDTLTGITVQPAGVTVLHPGDRIDPSLLNVTGKFSFTGERKLNASEFTVSPAAAPQTPGNFTVTVSAIRDYNGLSIRKTATLTMTVVPGEQTIDKSRVSITVDKETESIPYGVSYELPDVTAMAFDTDGKESDIHDSVTWSVQFKNGETWEDIAGYQDIPITKKMNGKLLSFLPAEHGYYRVVYHAEANDKEQTAVFNFSVEDTLTGISVDTTDTKTEYLFGEELDLSRLIVTREFSSSGESVIPKGEYRIDRGGYNRSRAGVYTITISYTAKFGGTKTDSFTVRLTDTISGFEITKLPSKRTYTYGEPLDLSDMEAKAFLLTGEETAIVQKDLEIRGFSSQTVGKQTVEILYHGFSGGSFEVSVEDKLFSIEIDTSEVITEFNVNETPDFSGLKVTWIGVSGERRLLAPGEYTVSPSSFKGYQNGSYSVTVSYTDAAAGIKRTASFRVTLTGYKRNYTSQILTGSFVLLLGGLAAAVAIIRKKSR